jgi:hypothetical protein
MPTLNFNPINIPKIIIMEKQQSQKIYPLIVKKTMMTHQNTTNILSLNPKDKNHPSPQLRHLKIPQVISTQPNRQKSPFLPRFSLFFWCPLIKIFWNLWPSHVLSLLPVCIPPHQRILMP